MKRSTKRTMTRSRAARAPTASHAAPHPSGEGSGDTYNVPGSGNVVGGQGHDIVVINNPPKGETLFDILKPHITLDALYNSGQRDEEDASTCHPDTRTRIIQTIEGWFEDDGYPVCWLHGPAGTGKSTIAHTIAETCEGRGRLAATFFFARKNREDIAKLVPTLAYQIAQHIPAIQDTMLHVLQHDRALLTRTVQHQFLKLIVEPLENVNPPNQSLFVVDGLDECARRESVVQLIKLLAKIVTTRKLPLRFLLTSRPERELEVAFQSHLTGSTALWLALEDSREDVRIYLQQRLLDIRREFDSIMRKEPMSWPPESVLKDLVAKSEGLFIHASTAVRYIGDGDESPQEKLEKVLRVHAGVDPLYTQVITEARRSVNFNTVMGCLMYLRQPIPIAELSDLLELDVRAAIDRCRSILLIPEDDSEAIRPYHASLRDFLTSQERSQDLFCVPLKYHAVLMTQCLKAINTALRNKSRPPRCACMEWHYHGSSLLSQPVACENIDLVISNAIQETKEINLEWLKGWMKEALFWEGVYYLTGQTPPSRGIPEVGRVLHRRLKMIKRIIDDFHYSYGDLAAHHSYFFGGHSLLQQHVDQFFSSRHSWSSTLLWRIYAAFDLI